MQVAQQQGKYMAALVKGGLLPGMESPQGSQGFKYFHKGSLAYVGNDNAVMVMLLLDSVNMASTCAHCVGLGPHLLPDTCTTPPITETPIITAC